MSQVSGFTSKIATVPSSMAALARARTARRRAGVTLPGIRSAALVAGLLIATLDCAMAQVRSFDCLLEPRLKIKLATPVSGVLREVMVDRGDIIHKEQVVAQLESSVDQAMLDLAKAKAASDATVKARTARLGFLTKKRDRTVTLMAKGATSAAALDEIESDFGVATEDLHEAEANMKIAQLDAVRAEQVLKLRSIMSPIDGVVAERNLLGGEYAYEQAPIMTIAQINPLNVEVFVPVALYGDHQCRNGGDRPGRGPGRRTLRREGGGDRSADRCAKRHIRHQAAVAQPRQQDTCRPSLQGRISLRREVAIEAMLVVSIIHSLK